MRSFTAVSTRVLQEISSRYGDTYLLRSQDKRLLTLYFFEETCPEWMATARKQLRTAKANAWSTAVLAEGEPTYAIAYDFIKKASYYA